MGSNCCLADSDNYVGFEYCPKRVRFATKLHTEYRFCKLVDGELPVPSAYFDYILVIAVLHHVSSSQLCKYVTEFRRTLKPGGTVIVMEPCLSKQSRMTNWFMRSLDRGQYLRDEPGYLEIFHRQGFETEVLSRFRKVLLYKELFFAATPK